MAQGMNSPAEIAKNYIEIGVGKTKVPAVKAFLLAVMAGIYIGVAGTASSTAVVSVEADSVARLISALIFPAGLAMVLLAGSELFTGNCLIIIPFLEKKVSLSAMVKNLLIVYIGNLAGSLIFSGLLAYGGVFALFDEGLAQTCVDIAVSKVNLSFMQAFIKGILCNIFVCVAVWMAFAVKSAGGRIGTSYFPIMAFVLCGFEHCVANMNYIGNGLFAKALYQIEAPTLTWGAFFGRNLLPVTLGNIVGGMAVGIVYWFVYLRKTAEASEQKDAA